ncbi:LemA family protein [Litorimonas sp. RW-G-Af-16]|uniref:LemA family protein n=1 Tax=Litorimonas sp. RW-G-Af-16 TaxID=3241168 RepID=UPI00390C81C7
MVIIFIILAALAGAIAFLYNGLVSKRQMAENGWSDIDVQLKRRADLIPNLVQTVKAYAKHEKQLFIDVTEKRNLALAAGENPQARGAAESALSQPVGRLLAIAEDYPELKASQNFLDLQNELSETEDKIEMARRFYNGAVRELNTTIETVPSNFIAGPFGFKKRDYFEIDPVDAAIPNVEFDT